MKLQLQLHPETRKKWVRFRRNRTAFASVVLLAGLVLAGIFASGIANDHPYVLRYHGKLYFPILVPPTATELGQAESYSVDYHHLKLGEADWAFFPPIRYNPYESNAQVASFPGPPSWDNPLGTDDRGRDVLARLLYGLRYSFLYAAGVWLLTYTFGALAGLVMGFYGGATDFFGQRAVEILVSVPSFFLLIILSSTFEPSLALLITISSLFGWISISYYMRAEALRLRKREFIEAALAIGQPKWKILIKHILPNSLNPIITLSPFALAGWVAALAQLDFLGFGLTPPTPSWGELLNQAKSHFTTAWWLAFFPSLALFGTLTLLNFIGEGLREAFDP